MPSIPPLNASSPVEEVRLVVVTEDTLRRIIREELRMALELRLEPKPEDAGGYLSVPAAAEYAACSEETIRAWIHSGRLPQKRVGRHYRVARSDVDRVLSAPPETPSRIDTERRLQEIIRSLRRSDRK